MTSPMIHPHPISEKCLRTTFTTKRNEKYDGIKVLFLNMLFPMKIGIWEMASFWSEDLNHRFLGFWLDTPDKYLLYWTCIFVKLVRRELKRWFSMLRCKLYHLENKHILCKFCSGQWLYRWYCSIFHKRCNLEKQI